ncbi:hypothetical protein LINGRAPRIM_LOCUS2027 [Linum grandiflorum]
MGVSVIGVYLIESIQRKGICWSTRDLVIWCLSIITCVYSTGKYLLLIEIKC